MKITECKDCKERYPGCHDVCDRYGREKEKNLQVKQLIQRKMHAERTIDRMKYDSKINSAKSKRR